MLQAWLSIGYIVLLAILVLAFILWRRGAPVLAIAALVVGIPLWFGWGYARPTWTFRSDRPTTGSRNRDSRGDRRKCVELGIGFNAKEAELDEEDWPVR